LICPFSFCAIFIGVIAVATFLSIVRAIRGPTGADRLVALDVMTNITIVLLALLGYYFQRFIYLDVALVYGILSFVGVIAAARYLEGGL